MRAGGHREERKDHEGVESPPRRPSLTSNQHPGSPMDPLIPEGQILSLAVENWGS